MGVIIWFCMCLFALCVPLTSSFNGQVLFANSTSILEFDVDTRYVTHLVHTGGHDVFALGYDYENEYVYFPRYTSMGDILRFAYPSKNGTLQTVIQSLSYPSGIAVDSTNEHIYWTEKGSNKLSRCNLDGGNVTVLSTLSSPWVIRLDFTNRWMYIVEQSKGISKSKLDLAEQQTIVDFTAYVQCMDIDTDEHRLYWINAEGDMKSAKDDGSDVNTILSINVLTSNYAIAVFGSYIYYANYNQLEILSKSSGSTPTVLYADAGWITSIFVFNQSAMVNVSKYFQEREWWQ